MIDYSLSRFVKVTILVFQFGLVGHGSAEEDRNKTLAYYFVSNTLLSFNLSGQIEPNPGLDGSDIEEFLSILEQYDQLFNQDFSVGSVFCRRYLESSEIASTEAFDLLFSDGVWEEKVERLGESFWRELEEKFGSRLMLRAVAQASALAKYFETNSQHEIAPPTVDFSPSERLEFSRRHCQLEH
jgi:hypothetical protein